MPNRRRLLFRLTIYLVAVYGFAHLTLAPTTDGPGEVLAFLGGSVFACLAYVVLGRLFGHVPSEGEGEDSQSG